MNTFDVIVKISTLVLALCNVVLVYFIFRVNNKYSSLKNIVLDYSITKFYAFYDNIINETSRLAEKNLDNINKDKILNNVHRFSASYELDFVDLFLDVNKDLYDNLKHDMDDLVDKIDSAAIDDGVNLYNKAKFSELITNPIIESKALMIKVLFSVVSSKSVKLERR